MKKCLNSFQLKCITVLMMVVGIYAAFIAERLFDHPLTYLLSLLPVHIVFAAWRAVSLGSFPHAFAVLGGAYIASFAIYLPSLVRRFKKRR